VLVLADRLEAFVRATGLIAAVATLLMILAITANVVARYAFHTGAVWLQELEWHLLAPIALFGVSYALATGDHVRVDMLYERFPPGVRNVLDLLAALVGLAVCILFVKFSLPFVERAWMLGEGSPDPGGLPARWALKALLPIGFVVLALQFLAMALRHAARLGKDARP
jgi:TRAP-type mannitol/chloroaromatic compound transport system permease small subunit